MTAAWLLLKRFGSIFSAGSILWKVLSNYHVVSEALKVINVIVENMFAEGRAMPTQEEMVSLCSAVSNILKTGIIDIPGVDEYELSLNIDKISAQISVGLKDSTSGKFISIPIPKKVSK